MAAGLVVLTACGGAGDEKHAAGGPASVTTAPTGTTAATDPTKAVLAAYQRDWQLWLEDNDPPNPNDPRLAQVEVNPQLSETRQAMRTYQEKGIVVRLPKHSLSSHRPVVSFSAEGQAATVVDCSVDDSVQLVRATGAVVDGVTQTLLIRSQMARLNGIWKVAASTTLQTWIGATRC
jgi:hypothetical protein